MLVTYQDPSIAESPQVPVDVLDIRIRYNRCLCRVQHRPAGKRVQQLVYRRIRSCLDLQIPGVADGCELRSQVTALSNCGQRRPVEDVDDGSRITTPVRT